MADTKATERPWEVQPIDWDGPDRGAAFIVGPVGEGLVGAALPWPSEIAEDVRYEFPRVVANARFIVRAVNNFDKLVEMLRDCLEYFEAREDADHNGIRYVGNEEMNRAQDVRALLSAIESEGGKNG